MPLHERHRQQRSKNWVLLAALLLFIGSMYGVTMLKVGM